MATNWGGTVASVPQLVCTAASWSVVTVTAKGSQGLWSQKRMRLKKEKWPASLFLIKNDNICLVNQCILHAKRGQKSISDKQVWSVILCRCAPKKNKVFVLQHCWTPDILLLLLCLSVFFCFASKRSLCCQGDTLCDAGSCCWMGKGPVQQALNSNVIGSNHQGSVCVCVCQGGLWVWVCGGWWENFRSFCQTSNNHQNQCFFKENLQDKRCVSNQVS